MSDMESDHGAATRPIGCRKLRPSGGSTVVTIPPAAMLQAGLNDDDEVEISVPERGTIILEETQADD